MNAKKIPKVMFGDTIQRELDQLFFQQSLHRLTKNDGTFLSPKPPDYYRRGREPIGRWISIQLDKRRRLSSEPANGVRR